MPVLYRATDVFVYPSMFEGFGFPPVEAMASGCPVISSTRGSLAEVVADAARTVDPERVEDIEGALRELATDATVRERLRVVGFRNARRFDWDLNAREVLDVYRKAVAARKA